LFPIRQQSACLAVADLVTLLPPSAHAGWKQEKKVAGITSKKAADLSREECQTLMNWCDWQREDLWSGMSLQDILNVYHVSSEWDTFEAWSEEEGDVARHAWNSVVENKGHHLILRDDERRI
jgi:hypothetical protein